MLDPPDWQDESTTTDRPINQDATASDWRENTFADLRERIQEFLTYLIEETRLEQERVESGLPPQQPRPPRRRLSLVAWLVAWVFLGRLELARPPPVAKPNESNRHSPSLSFGGNTKKKSLRSMA